MKKMKHTFVLGMLSLSFVLMLSCKNENKTQVNTNTPTVEDMENLSKQDTIKITLNSNDRMQFDKSALQVFEGQTVILTLVHTGTMPVSAMGHNFVLLAKGTSVSEFAKEALKAQDNDYIPEDGSNLIAYTELIGGGESTTITFQAPEKGTYDFLCSFPGHSSLMKGKFHVK